MANILLNRKVKVGFFYLHFYSPTGSTFRILYPFPTFRAFKVSLNYTGYQDNAQLVITISISSPESVNNIEPVCVSQAQSVLLKCCKTNSTL